MARKKKSEMSFEIIGGIFLVERFADGTERREEIDSLAVLQLLLEVTEQHVDKLSKKK